MATKVLRLTPNNGEDPFDFEDGANGSSINKGGLTLPFPDMDESFADSPYTEGAILTNSKPKNVEGSVQTVIFGDTSNEFWAKVRAWQRVLEACHEYGGELLYEPEDGDTLTFEVESAWPTEMPQDHMYIQNKVALGTCKLILRPYAKLDPQTGITLSMKDSFASDTVTNQNWQALVGTGVAVSGGKLTFSATSQQHRGRYGVKVADHTHTIKFTTGASVAASWYVGIGKVITSGSSEANVYVDSGGNIYVYDLGGAGQQGSQAITLSANTSYWLQFQIVGNVITGRIYSTDPNGANPTAALKTTTYTLTGASATARGSGVYGQPALDISPKGTDWTVDDWRVDAATIETSAPILDLYALDVPGSVAALCRLNIEERSSQNRHFYEVGVGHSYGGGDVPALIDSDNMTVQGGSTQTTRTGAHDPNASGNNVIRSVALSSTALSIASKASIPVNNSIPHRVKARIWAPGVAGIYLRALYFGEWSGDTYTPWTALTNVNNWVEVDLGVVRADPEYGSIDLTIQAIQTSGSNAVDLDYILLIPADHYGKAINATSYGTVSGYLDSEDGARKTNKLRVPYSGGYPKLLPGDNRITFRARRTDVSNGGLDTTLTDICRVSLDVTPRTILL